MSIVPAASPATSPVAAAASSPLEATCPPINDAEIVAAALAMNLAGGGGSGAQLLASLLDESIDLAELAARINRQPAIAVRVMRVANSAYYGQSGKVATVMRAAQVVGGTALRGIAAAASFDRMSTPPNATGTLDMAAFRQHSLATACAAQALAQVAAPQWADPAFMAGLLHDVGLLVQWRLRPQWRARFRAGADAAPPDATGPSDAEREALGVGATHAHCGRILLEAWRLPPDLIDAVDRHDTAHAAPAPEPQAARLAGLLQLADQIATASGNGFDVDRPPVPIEAIDLAALQLTPAQVEAVAAGLPDTVARLGAAFGD